MSVPIVLQHKALDCIKAGISAQDTIYFMQLKYDLPYSEGVEVLQSLGFTTEPEEV